MQFRHCGSTKVNVLGAILSNPSEFAIKCRLVPSVYLSHRFEKNAQIETLNHVGFIFLTICLFINPWIYVNRIT